MDSQVVDEQESLRVSFCIVNIAKIFQFGLGLRGRSREILVGRAMYLPFSSVHMFDASRHVCFALRKKSFDMVSRTPSGPYQLST